MGGWAVGPHRKNREGRSFDRLGEVRGVCGVVGSGPAGSGRVRPDPVRSGPVISGHLGSGRVVSGRIGPGGAGLSTVRPSRRDMPLKHGGRFNKSKRLGDFGNRGKSPTNPGKRKRRWEAGIPASRGSKSRLLRRFEGRGTWPCNRDSRFSELPGEGTAKRARLSSASGPSSASRASGASGASGASTASLRIPNSPTKPLAIVRQVPTGAGGGE